MYYVNLHVFEPQFVWHYDAIHTELAYLTTMLRILPGT